MVVIKTGYFNELMTKYTDNAGSVRNVLRLVRQEKNCPHEN